MLYRDINVTLVYGLFEQSQFSIELLPVEASIIMHASDHRTVQIMHSDLCIVGPMT